MSATPLTSPAGTYFRYHHEKADGRSLWLYGTTPLDPDALPEDDLGSPCGGSLRWHPLRREWAVYAGHRQNRTYKPAASADPLAPMRPGGPQTEIPFAAFEVAVFENRFPGFHPGAALTDKVPADIEARPPTGACEVVVFTSDHEGSLATIGQERRSLLLSAWCDRYDAHRRAGRRFVMPFESRGEEVGVTLHHPHGQIYAFDVLPPVQERMVAAFQDGYRLGDAVAGWGEGYAVAERSGIMAHCPPFARFPYETWLVPRERHAGPWSLSQAEALGLTELLGDMTARYDRLFGRPAATMLSLQASPAECEDDWHFHAVFTPILRGPDRVKYLASVEQHAGLFTVDILPERAAGELREVAPEAGSW